MVKVLKVDPAIVRCVTEGKNSAKVTGNHVPANEVLPQGITLGLSGVSSFLQIFNKTSDEDNYFQFKIDPNTGKHFKPDIFQRASGMNLYLGNDVLVTAPTGTGKTAIAEYIITKNLKENKKTFYTTPLKALSNEKFRDFSKIYGEENVGLLTGDTKINTNAPIVIMTTEVYRNMAASGYFSLENPNKKMLENDLGTVIFDELQYLGDIDRGGVWEQSIMFTPKNVQILSLSATIGNNEEINNWIASTKGRKGISVIPDDKYLPNKTMQKETVLINVPSENRHVPLTFDNTPVAAEINIPKGHSKKEQIKAKRDGAAFAGTIYAKPAQETYKDITRRLNKDGKLPAIYFIFSKKECKKLLNYLSKEGEVLTTKEDRTNIENIIKQYKRQGIYLGRSLNTDALMKGYAIHNAGLLPSQKKLVEELFQNRLVKVVLATETLSAGINMPAKTTVISSPRKPASTSDGGIDHKRNLSPNEFHQMAGRAGRRGIDTHGYCLPLSCNVAQMSLYNQLIAQSANPLASNLDVDYSFIANYTSEYFNEETLEKTLAKSLYTHNADGSLNTEKLNELMNRYRIRRDILIRNKYINDKGKLTTKGELIKTLSGYEQIPIINLIDNKELRNLDAVQITGIIGGLANIEYNTIGEFPEKTFGVSGCLDFDYLNASKKAYYEVKDYQKLSSALHPDREISINADIMEHVYRWAELNSHHGSSRDNWEALYEGDLRFSIRDEGSLFKEIAATIDLMKQLTYVAQKGEEFSTSDEDKEYYLELADKLEEGISLLQREPIVEDAV